MSVNMNQIFLIAFIFCLTGYVLHTIFHFFEYKGYRFGQSKMFEIALTIVIFIGYVGWFLMFFFDPIRIDIADYIAVPLGLAIGVPGLVLFVVSAKSKRGFGELDYLVTDGIYSKLRNPMYLGIMLIYRIPSHGKKPFNFTLCDTMDSINTDLEIYGRKGFGKKVRK